jgi:hypothetical protein
MDGLIFDEFKIRQRIENAFEEIVENRIVAADIAFHLTD